MTLLQGPKYPFLPTLVFIAIPYASFLVKIIFELVEKYIHKVIENTLSIRIATTTDVNIE